MKPQWPVFRAVEDVKGRQPLELAQTAVAGERLRRKERATATGILIRTVRLSADRLLHHRHAVRILRIPDRVNAGAGTGQTKYGRQCVRWIVGVNPPGTLLAKIDERDLERCGGFQFGLHNLPPVSVFESRCSSRWQAIASGLGAAVGCDEFGLVEDKLCCGWFLVRGVAVLEEESLDGGAEFCAYLFLDAPVGLGVTPNDLDEVVGNLPEGVIP